jgi:hypothetical protein
MMPGSALTRLLQHPDLVTTADLSVIAGDIEGDSPGGQLKLLATDWFYGADHDLVVNTGSMFGGLRRPTGARASCGTRAPTSIISTISPTTKASSWLLAGLTRADEERRGLPAHGQAAARSAALARRGAPQPAASPRPRPMAVMLPGTMGSALQAAGDPVWLNYWPCCGAGWRAWAWMRAAGTRSEPIDLLDDFYGPLLEFLARSHRVEIFPYDWRLSVRDAACGWRTSSNPAAGSRAQGQPVHLVAHSMGGLVVRAMIADGGRGTALWRRILKLPNSRFMMLGTPNLGSHEAVRWLTGHNPTQAQAGPAGHHPRHRRDHRHRATAFPGLVELLPFDPGEPDFSQPVPVAKT